MKKTVSILLIVSFVFNTIGFYVLFFAVKYQNKERITELIHKGIVDDHLILLKIPKKITSQNNASFQRIESDELKYNGNMYDIVKEESHDGLIYFYCISDEVEDEIIASIESYTQNNSFNNQLKNKYNQNFIKQLLKDLLKDYLIVSTPFFYFFSLSNHYLLWSYCSKSTKGHLSMLIAPPRLN
jgi:hypothetical protein